ncbi:MAG TPA: indolepyruvate oxidoreductase subunit beta [Bacteroidales bacterium]|nr:indolepyruvate oxidoreductase subunit beta [Bacteroidales bacterium]
MKQDIILSGVGGQGIVSIASVIGLAALDENIFVKQSEVHGMSQRGGAVMSHLRISSQPIASDLIPLGKADMILSAEPMEALRYLPYLSQQGWVISNSKPFINIENYPDLQNVNEELAGLPHVVLADAEQIAEQAGSVRTSNMVMLGVASPFLHLSVNALQKGIEKLFASKTSDIIEMNIKAFMMGRSFGESKTKL